MRRGGFTLVEVVASLLLASVTLVAVLNLIVTNMKSGQINNQRLAAFSLLIEKLEDARAKGFSAFVADAGNVGGIPMLSSKLFPIWAMLTSKKWMSAYRGIRPRGQTRAKPSAHCWRIIKGHETGRHALK